MKTVVVASAKGGTGKTTLVSALAVRAWKEVEHVGLVDLNDDQGSLHQWHYYRGHPHWPGLFEIEKSLAKELHTYAAEEEIAWWFVDTPPSHVELIETAVLAADAVLCPVRASIFDINAAKDIAEMCSARRKPMAFVLTAVDTRLKALNDDALEALAQLGPVFTGRLTYRPSWINALPAGKSGAEIDAVCAAEINGVWQELQALLGEEQPPRLGRVK